jgi:hypothetical protein
MKGTQHHTVNNMREHFMLANEYERDNKASLKDIMSTNTVGTTQAQAPSQQQRNNMLDGYHYCWTHGVATHSGANCRRLGPGHIPEEEPRQYTKT